MAGGTDRAGGWPGALWPACGPRVVRISACWMCAVCFSRLPSWGHSQVSEKCPASPCLKPASPLSRLSPWGKPSEGCSRPAHGPEHCTSGPVCFPPSRASSGLRNPQLPPHLPKTAPNQPSLPGPREPVQPHFCFAPTLPPATPSQVARLPPITDPLCARRALPTSRAPLDASFPSPLSACVALCPLNPYFCSHGRFPALIGAEPGTGTHVPMSVSLRDCRRPGRRWGRSLETDGLACTQHTPCTLAESILTLPGKDRLFLNVCSRKNSYRDRFGNGIKSRGWGDVVLLETGVCWAST